MNTRTCRSCGAAMAAEDAFCPECGVHVWDRARIPEGEATQPGGASTEAPRASSPAPDESSAYERPYERLDNLEPARPDATAALPVGADGEPDPIRTFDAPMQIETSDGGYEEEPEPSEQKLSPALLALAAVFFAIIVAGIVMAGWRQAIVCGRVRKHVARRDAGL
jgi:hypothetical protein